GKTISDRRRGRLFGYMQAAGSVLAVAGGVVVQLFGYVAVFAVNLVSTGVAVYLRLGMKEPRHERENARGRA
ncbi:MAG: hypothetical protein ACYC53_08085, partial [Bacillota bacterium]